MLFKGTPAGRLASGSEGTEGVTAPAVPFSRIALNTRHVSQLIIKGVKQMYCSDVKQHQKVLYSIVIRNKEQ